MKSTTEKLAEALRGIDSVCIGKARVDSRKVSNLARRALAEYDAQQQQAQPDPLSPVATVYDAMGDRT